MPFNCGVFSRSLKESREELRTVSHDKIEADTVQCMVRRKAVLERYAALRCLWHEATRMTMSS
jgi:hypothetical protein